jgi:uncharacterized protein YrrD
MKIINQHLGLPVICLNTSERVGDLLRFVTDQVAGQVVAVAITRQWYQEPSAVAFADCKAFGQNVILINNAADLKPISQMPEIGIHLEASNDARQRTAITESGRLLGSVTDEAFDETTGEVSAYRLDVLADSGTGRTVYIGHDAFVTASATVAILKDDVLDRATDELVPSDTSIQEPEAGGQETGDRSQGAGVRGQESEARGQESGVRGQDSEPGTRNSEPAAPSALAVQPSIPDFPVSLLGISEEALAEEEPDDDLADTVSQEVRDKMEGHNRVMMALVIGKTAGATVADSEGQVIVEEGSPITTEIAQAAAESQRLYELWTNAKD